MLILCRKPTESIIIEDDIKITVLSIRNFNQIRLGIAAPGLRIEREERYIELLSQEMPIDEVKQLLIKKFGVNKNIT
jgi:carbon storage regulator CsrA